MKYRTKMGARCVSRRVDDRPCCLSEKKTKKEPKRTHVVQTTFTHPRLVNQGFDVDAFFSDFDDYVQTPTAHKSDSSSFEPTPPGSLSSVDDVPTEKKAESKNFYWQTY